MADELSLPFEQIPLEMLYRGLYHFGVARQKGIASEFVFYFAAVDNQDLGVVKKLRKPLANIDLRPFPRDDLTFTPSV